MDTRLRYDALDGWRGLAALLIVVFHAYAYPHTLGAPFALGGAAQLTLLNLDAAVGWFFALSGFVIFLPFARAAAGDRPIPARRAFLRRRAGRILPAYYAAILVAWLAQGHYSGNAWRDLAEHLTFTYLISPAHRISLLTVAWSLGNELTFYLLLAVAGPLLCQWCRRASGRRGRLGRLVSVVSAAIALSLTGQIAPILAGVPLTPQSAVWYWGPGALFSAFGVGMLVAVGVAATGGRRVIPRGIASVLPAIALAITVAGVAYRLTLPTALLFFDFAAWAFGAILVAVTLGPADAALTRLAGWAPARWCGAISYGVYLYHWPLLTELSRRGWLFSVAPADWARNAALLAALVIAVAAASWYGLERPLQRVLSRRPAAPRTTRAALPAPAGD